MKTRILVSVALGAFLVGAVGPRVFGQAPTNPVTIIGIAPGVSLATPVGTAGVPNASVVSVQGITSMTPIQTTVTSALPTGTNTIGAITGTLSDNTAAPGAGNNFGAMPCKVGASAPTVTDGRLSFVRCLTDGSMAMSVINGSATDSEDASVASGQSSIALTIPLSYRYNGSAWVREVADPCSYLAKTYVPFSISTATTTQLIAASASNYNYICAINLGPIAAADNIALVEDDTSACASPTAGMAGGTTAATGWNVAANGGLNFGNGLGTVFKTAATNRYTCFITSAAVQASGTIVYVQVP